MSHQKICSYRSILLGIDNWSFLPINQYIFLYIMTSFFFFNYSFHVSLESSLIPRYLALLLYIIVQLFSLIGSYSTILLVYSTWIVYLNSLFSGSGYYFFTCSLELSICFFDGANTSALLALLAKEATSMSSILVHQRYISIILI